MNPIKPWNIIVINTLWLLIFASVSTSIGQNQLPIDYNSNCKWTCDQWAGVDGSGYNYCDHEWSSKKYCVQSTKGKIRDFCQVSCNNTLCGKFSES